ncbi:MAG: PSD1 and planctomycete cytochrome C domain-containing protein [Verrucomicrobia bacterium]|nr:PSD1 and planctomycete cytochrome C domain-containing protein [Verrucomicrobiota bacterium]
MLRSAFSVIIVLVSCLYLAGESTIDYSREILPILSENCFECHGSDEGAREADLRLDTAEGAYADLIGAVAVAPGDPEGSELIYRIETKIANDRMPPKDSKKSLTVNAKDLLRKWIEQGGKYDEHWAFQPPQKSDLPKTAKHPIDAFVSQRLKKAGLKPSKTASATTLVRRLYLDLIGLPPNPAEIAAFIKSYRKNKSASIDVLVNELMQRPAYGEKWTRLWLDVARYADSNGFEKDKPRDQWIYRDWVIQAINDDMPYDQFLIEQLAGDLLPNRTQDQLVASGFMRNGMVNEEGAIIPEQFRLEGIFDRMDCFGKAALGLSLQCAQCHSHKFDPISHEEYYGLFAFFNETHEAKSWVYSDEQLETIDNVRSQVLELENGIREKRPDWKTELAAWKQEQLDKNSIWTIWDTSLQDWEGGLNHPEELDDHSILTLGHPTVTGYSITEGESNLPIITGIRLEALKHGDQPFEGPGRSYWGTFAISEIELYRKLPGEEEWTQIEMKDASADFETEVGKLNDYYNHKKLDPDNKRRIGPAAYLIDGDTETGWAPDRGPILRHTESAAVIVFKEPCAMPEGSQLKVHLIQSHGGDGNDRENQQLGRYRFSLTDVLEPKAPTYDHAATLAIQKNGQSLSPREENAVFRAWRNSVADLDAANKEIDKLEATYPEARTSVLHSAELQPGIKRVTRLLERGAWNKPQQEITRGTPAFLNPLPVDNPTRLDLAKWVTSKEAPLTARVQVNRVWQALFGNGLVATPEDYGNRSPKPEYLDILDWLAVDFMENDWSIKELIRTILASDTYLQSSNLTIELREKDPNNILLARGPRFRAEAEVVRDIALAAAGLLTHKVGGPSVYPPVPESVLYFNYVKPDYWEPATDENRYRRSLYMFRKRSMPDPVLSSFDAPNGDVSCTRRIRSNTPLSALTSLNEPIFVEASQGLAQRILREGGDTDADRVNYGYLLTTGRPASKLETKEIIGLIESQKERLADGWLDIRRIAFRDPEIVPDLPEGITPREVASWAIASRVLLNLDETLTKN